MVYFNFVWGSLEVIGYSFGVQLRLICSFEGVIRGSYIDCNFIQFTTTEKAKSRWNLGVFSMRVAPTTVGPSSTVGPNTTVGPSTVGML